MRRASIVALVVTLTLCAGVLLTMAQAPQKSQKIYAQTLIDKIVAQHNDIVVCAMHVAKPGEKDNKIIAANIPRIGNVSDEDDLRVASTGKDHLAPDKKNGRFEVITPLKTKAGQIIGSINFVYKYNGSDNTGKKFVQAAHAVRDEIQPRIASTEDLFKPVM